MTNGKTALVTGANKGIGFEIARQLAVAGFTVWLGCRDSERGETAVAKLRAEGHDARLLELDVTSNDSVRVAAEALARQTQHLDVLVNNAAIAGTLGIAPLDEPADEIKTIYEVNVFGPIRVTQAFVPLLKASAAARVVMMSSELGSIAAALDEKSEFYPFVVLGYGTSKTALNAVTVSFAKALQPFGIKVNAADPGFTATDLNNNTGYRTVVEAAKIAVELSTLGEDGETAGYFNHKGRLAW